LSPKELFLALKIMCRVLSLSFRDNCSPSKNKSYFCGVAKKVGKFKGLAAGICGIHWLLRAQALSE